MRAKIFVMPNGREYTVSQMVLASNISKPTARKYLEDNCIKSYYPKTAGDMEHTLTNGENVTAEELADRLGISVQSAVKRLEKSLDSDIVLSPCANKARVGGYAPNVIDLFPHKSSRETLATGSILASYIMETDSSGKIRTRRI